MFLFLSQTLRYSLEQGGAFTILVSCSYHFYILFFMQAEAVSVLTEHVPARLISLVVTNAQVSVRVRSLVCACYLTRRKQRCSASWFFL